MTYYRYNTGDIVAYTIDKPLLILQRDGYKKNVNGEVYMTHESYLTLALDMGEKVMLSRDWVDLFCQPHSELTPEAPDTKEAKWEAQRQGLDGTHQLRMADWSTY